MSVRRPGEPNGNEPTPPPADAPDRGDWAYAFLAAFTGETQFPDGTRATMNFSKAARHAGVHPKTVTSRIQHDDTFADLYEQAENALTDAAEAVIYDRVVNGTSKPIFEHGTIVAHVREVDNRLAQWWLERRRPEKYHIATRVEHVTPGTPGAFTFQLGDKPLELNPGE